VSPAPSSAIAISEGKIRASTQRGPINLFRGKGTNKATVTLRDLITMESGLDVVDDLSAAIRRHDQYDRQPGRGGYALSERCIASRALTGTTPTATQETFSRVLNVATGMEAGQYAQAKLFGPIGMHVDEWGGDQLGQTMTYCCIISSGAGFRPLRLSVPGATGAGATNRWCRSSG